MSRAFAATAWTGPWLFASGEVVELWADDPAAVVDVPHFCAEAGHDLVSTDEAEGYQIYRVRKAG